MRKYLSRRNIVIAIVTIGLLLGGFGIYRSATNPPSYETVDVIKSKIVQSVSASGEIKSADEIELKLPIGGKLVDLAVAKNDRVKKGTYIGSLDVAELQKKLTKSLRDYSKERNDFDQDSQVTYKDQIITDTIRRILEKNQWDLDKAVLDVELADLAKKNAVIYSPIAGVVTQVFVHEGTSVTTTSSVVTIEDPDNIAFIAEVDEEDIAKVAVGQKVEISLDAFEGRIINGEVVEVDYASSTTDSGGKVYLVKVAIDDKENLKLDMSGDAEIIIDSRPDTLVIPRSVVQERNGEKIVKILEDNKAKEVSVKTGLTSSTSIEIIDGLSEGQKVIVGEQTK